MKRVDFANGNTLKNILQTMLPMLVAQILALLYNIVDRIYIAHIPEVGTTALGAVGLCFPLILMVTAFTNLYGLGGSPLFSIERGRRDEAAAAKYMNTSFFLILVTAAVLTVTGELISRPMLTVFGASETAMQYAIPYLRIYLLGSVFSMIATGMTPFITAQGFSIISMITVIIGAGSNIVLDPLFIFTLGMGVCGAAVATILSQTMACLFVLRFLFGKRADPRLHLLTREEVRNCGQEARSIYGLGIASFIMLFTTCLVQISANRVIAQTGGDIYVSVMTIITSSRQMFETPLLAIAEGTLPIISYNYGARRPEKMKEAGIIMFCMGVAYSLVLWIFMRIHPEWFISIFSSDTRILTYAVPAFHLYFSTFVFMNFQYTGLTMFKALNKKRHAMFFSLFRKIIIMIPLIYLLPYVFNMGVNGVYVAEPVSNFVGGIACFTTMMLTVMPELRLMKQEHER